jgi:thiamine biosynthesis lipoprotein
LRLAALALLGLAAACASAPREPLVAVSDGRYVMGTILEITLYVRDRADGERALEELFGVAERLDGLLSVYSEASQVSGLNRSAGRGPQAVDPELAELLARSRELSALTRGSFDVTVGPLVALWTRAARRGAPPSPEALAAARARVGAERVRVDAEGRVVLEPGVSLNLGGAAKGYALDRMLPLLRARGIERALLNFGQSSSWAVGTPPGEAAWRLLARGAEEGWLGVLNLRDQALSVSASLGQFVEIGGRRYGHILDPRSGEPLSRRREALVVAPDATLAEALSKALLILGQEEGVALVAGQPGCEGLLVDAAGGRWATPGWAAAVGFEPVDPGSGRALSSAQPQTPIREGWPRPS